MTGRDSADAAGAAPRRLFYFNAGFLRQKRVRRILQLKGYDLQLGRPGAEDMIAVWGRSPYAARGEAMAERSGAGLLRIEDAFLRSLHLGRAGDAPTGLLIDRTGVHFDGDGPSDLEALLAAHPLDDTALLDRARGGMARLREAQLSKYNAFQPEAPVPEPGYVLVIDQARGDASVTHGGADVNTFREMLYWAQEENPGARILIKTHPETRQGFRPGHFGPAAATGNVAFFTDPVSPWALLEGAIAVYVVSSQLGFEAILAGHRPQVFGRPFYAGWGLTDDRHPLAYPRRGRTLTRAQLFGAAMILYPTWYDPARDRLCRFEDALEQLAAETREWREDCSGWTAEGMRLWKRGFLQDFFGSVRRVRFTDAPAPPRRRMVWAGKARPDDTAVRVEDGFLRSRGLGAELVPPLSLVLDDLGIYYDPAGESRLERLIAARADLRPDQKHRADALIRRLVALGLSKYNLGAALPDLSDLPEGRRILVPGQVEDDASVIHGAGEVNTNLALLRKVREANPEAIVLYKPHPDVAAGLRAGAVEPADLVGLADAVPLDTDPAALVEAVDEVWTMTSLLGFEALIRGCRVTVTGAPFYAGWGLTRDLGAVPARRRLQVPLAGLVHAALIDYPRYRDPVSGRACPVEVAVDRLASGRVSRPGLGNRLLSKMQGALSSYAHLWR